MQYRRRDSMARLYDLNPRTIDVMTREMVASGRYPEDFLLKDIGYVLIEEAAFRDYLKNRRALKGAAGKFVAPYIRPSEGEPVYIGGTR